MTEKKAGAISAEQRRARQEEMLKANLRRRKKQARARRRPAGAIETDGEHGGDDSDASGEASENLPE